MANTVLEVLRYLGKRVTKSHLKNIPSSVKVNPSEVPNSVMEALFSNSSKAVKVSDDEIAKIFNRPTLSDYTLKGKIKNWRNYFKKVSSIKEAKLQRLSKEELPLDVRKALYPEPEAKINRYVYVS